MDELVEIIRGNNHRTRHKDAYVLPFVVQLMFLQHVVEESESSTLSAHRSAATTAEPDRVVVGLRRITGYHTQSLVDTIIVDKTDIHLPHVLDVHVVMDLQGADCSTDGEQTARKEPFGEIVIITQSPEGGRRNG